jgi:hypothetical protein
MWRNPAAETTGFLEETAGWFAGKERFDCGNSRVFAETAAFVFRHSRVALQEKQGCLQEKQGWFAENSGVLCRKKDGLFGETAQQQ